MFLLPSLQLNSTLGILYIACIMYAQIKARAWDDGQTLPRYDLQHTLKQMGHDRFSGTRIKLVFLRMWQRKLVNTSKVCRATLTVLRN